MWKRENRHVKTFPVKTFPVKPARLAINIHPYVKQKNVLASFYNATRAHLFTIHKYHNRQHHATYKALLNKADNFSTLKALDIKV
jgi:hypothetical protein